MPKLTKSFLRDPFGQRNHSEFLLLAALLVCIGCAGQERAPVYNQPPPASLSAGCAGQKLISLPDQPTSVYVMGPKKTAKRVLVFVHGIFGDSRSTWRNNTGKSFFDLVQHDLYCKGENSPFRGSDVYTFGFPSRFIGSSFTIDQAVQNLRERLLADGILNYEQIIFVAHSMGGLVAERFLLTYQSEAKKIPLAVLYSTPHEGSELANIGQYVLTNPGLVTMVFGDHNQFLDGHDNMWKNAIDQGTIRTRIRCAFETRKTGPVRVVTQKSATRICHGNAMPVDADHIGIVKPVPPGQEGNDDSFAFLKNALTEIDQPARQGIELASSEKPARASGILIELLDGASLGKDAEFVSHKIHRNLAEFLSNLGHLVIAPPLSVAGDSVDNQISNRIIIKADQDDDNLTIQLVLTAGDGSLVSATELTGPVSDLKKMYKVLPEALFFGLDVSEATLSKRNSAKSPTNRVEAYANYLYARRMVSSGDAESAEVALRKAISLDERFALAYWSLGTLLKDQARLLEGRKFIEDAIRIDPDHPKVTFTSPSKQSHPVPSLLSAIRGGKLQSLEPGLTFRKAFSKEYGIEMRSWSVDPSLFDIQLVEQKDPHGSSINEFLEDSSVLLALNGGFFEIDHLKRISPAGVLVVNGRIRNASVHEKLSGAFVRNNESIKIVKAKELGPLTDYIFAVQTGPVLVRHGGKLDIIKNDYDRLNRAAVCLRDQSIVFVTVHGLHGNGLSLYEFAELLAARDIDGGLECNVAINLDGGPSTQVGMNLRNMREQVDGLWKVHNAIIVRRK